MIILREIDRKKMKHTMRCLKNALFLTKRVTAVCGKTVPFEKRYVGCEEQEKINYRRIYDALRINFFEATK